MSSKISKYVIEPPPLGEGGFGRVYRAFDPDVKRPVAIKVLTAQSSPELLKRFQAEIGTTGNLAHKNIVTLYECGEENGVPYLVMELLEGKTLQKILADGTPLTLLEKVRMMAEVADGLAYAHSRGVVHRDVKPANVMLLPDGSIKIMDFGIARMSGAALHASGGGAQTQEGHIVGTVPYMAPEQFAGQAGEQSDIFAYGVMYYELLSGIHPFSTDDVWGTIARIQSHEPAPLDRLVPECPEGLDILVRTALAKDRELRYQTFAELILDSETILTEIKKELAAKLVAEIGGLLDAKELPRAEGKLREALELDPGNRDAQRLRQAIRNRKQTSANRRRLAALCQEAEALAGQRDFSAAIERLESALRIDSRDERVQKALADARARLAARSEANRLVYEARREQLRGDLDAARERLRNALRLDPDNEDAKSTELRLAAAAGRRLEEALAAASALLARGQHAEAARALGGVDDPHAHELLARIEHERRAAQLQQAAAAIRDALQANDLARAGQFLKHHAPALERQPGAAETFAPLEAELQTRLHRLREITRLHKQGLELLIQGRASEALDLLAAALGRFPGDPGLEQLRESAQQAWAGQQRAEMASEAVAAAPAGREAGDLAAAVERPGQAPQGIGEVSGSVALERQLSGSAASEVPATPRAAKPSRWRLVILVSLCAATLAVMAVVFGPRFLPSKPPAPPQPRVRMVEIRTDPPGATVRLEDLSCVTPNCRLELPAGQKQYTVEAHLEGYLPARAVVGPGDGSVDLTLQPVPVPKSNEDRASTGRLAIQAGVPNTLVTVDAVPRGRTDSTGALELPLAAGGHRVAVARPGYETPPEQRVEIAVGQTRTLQVKLRPKSAVFELHGAPAGIEVRARGVLLGKTGTAPVFTAPLEPGELEIEVSDGKASRRLGRKLEPGQVLALDWRSVELPRPPKQQPVAEALEAQDWDRVRGASDAAQLEAFAARYPDGPHAAAARARLEDLVWARTNQGDPQSLRDYANRYPAGARAKEALAKIAEIAWTGTDKRDARAIQAFLDQYPQSAHRGEGRAILEQLERQRLEAEQALAQQRAQTQAIRSALDRFNSAFERRRLRDIEEVWPGIPDRYTEAIRRPGVGYVMLLRATGEPRVNGDTATASGEVVIRTSVKGQAEQVRPVTVSLRKSGDKWVIAGIGQ